jgi:HEAT repeat protein
MPDFFVPAFLILWAGMFFVSMADRRRRVQGYAELLGGVMQGMGLTHVTTSTTWFGDRAEVLGRSGDLSVRTAVLLTGQDAPMSFRIGGLHPPHGVSMHGRWRHVTAATKGGATVGDGDFDSTFVLTGPPAVVQALLDAETRNLLLSLAWTGSVALRGHELTLDIPSNGANQSLALKTFLETARRLDMPVELMPRLAVNARQDPLPGVRLQSLLLLSREFGQEPLTRETLGAACGDPQAEVRLRAALALGGAHLSVAAEIAESPAVEDAASAMAISALGDRLPIERVRAILDHALRARRMRTAHECLDRLGRSGDPSAAGVLSKVLGIENGELAVHAARALAKTSSPDSERALVGALGRDVPELRDAAATALGRCGSVSAVWPLKEAANKHTERAFQRASRQAIAQIQSRAGGVTPGQLSIAASEAGQLSIADSEAGQLSFPPVTGGEVSVVVDPKAKG